MRFGALDDLGFLPFRCTLGFAMFCLKGFEFWCLWVLGGFGRVYPISEVLLVLRTSLGDRFYMGFPSA